ncbi:MAG: hypothetical protein WCW16_01205 [Candidatus Magasanikbacteria bacterium]
MTRLEDIERITSRREEAGLDRQIQDERPREGGAIPRPDANGVLACPECGKVANPDCRNCFHARFKDGDPFEPNPEANYHSPDKRK